MATLNLPQTSRHALLVALAVAYYIGLGLMPGVTYRLPINDIAEWLGASRSVAAYAYLIGTHTIGVLLVAVPVAAVLTFALSYGRK